VKTVLLATGAFAVFKAVPSLALSAALFVQGPRRPDVLGDVLVAAYLVAVSSALATLGFLVPTALSATWRRLAARRAVSIAAVLGLLSPVAALLVIPVTARAILPLFHSAPWLAIGLFHGLPGVGLGVAALVIVRAWRPAPAPAVSR
jgi:hypothetical protein